MTPCSCIWSTYERIEEQAISKLFRVSLSNSTTIGSLKAVIVFMEDEDKI